MRRFTNACSPRNIDNNRQANCRQVHSQETCGTLHTNDQFLTSSSPSLSRRRGAFLLRRLLWGGGGDPFLGGWWFIFFRPPPRGRARKSASHRPSQAFSFLRGPVFLLCGNLLSLDRGNDCARPFIFPGWSLQSGSRSDRAGPGLGRGSGVYDP